jgi:hypothetical protein
MYRATIVVDGRPLQWQHLPEAAEDDRPFVESADGQKYEVILTNDSERGVFMRLFIDGVKACSNYVRAGQSRSVPGFRIPDPDGVHRERRYDAFRFAKPELTEHSGSGSAGSDVGRLTIEVWEAVQSRLSANDGGSAPERPSRDVVLDERQKAHIFARYTTGAGVIVKQETKPSGSQVYERGDRRITSMEYRYIGQGYNALVGMNPDFVKDERTKLEPDTPVKRQKLEHKLEIKGEPRTSGGMQPKIDGQYDLCDLSGDIASWETVQTS